MVCGGGGGGGGGSGGGGVVVVVWWCGVWCVVVGWPCTCVQGLPPRACPDGRSWPCAGAQGPKNLRAVTLETGVPLSHRRRRPPGASVHCCVLETVNPKRFIEGTRPHSDHDEATGSGDAHQLGQDWRRVYVTHDERAHINHSVHPPGAIVHWLIEDNGLQVNATLPTGLNQQVR